MIAGTKSVRCSVRILLAALLFGFAVAARAADYYPLRPPDTSSPRATLQGFIADSDEIYRRFADALDGYAASDRLYLTPEERAKQLAGLSDARKMFRYLDLSRVPPVLRDTVPPERFRPSGQSVCETDVISCTFRPEQINHWKDSRNIFHVHAMCAHQLIKTFVFRALFEAIQERLIRIYGVN